MTLILKKRLAPPAACFLLAALCGCGSGFPPFHRHPDFGGISLKDRKLLVLPLPDVAFENAYMDRTLVNRMLCKGLERYVDYAPVECLDSLPPSAEELRDTLLPLHEYDNPQPESEDTARERFSFPRPEFFEKRGIVPDLALFIASPKFTVHSFAQGESSLIFTATYVIWDYRAHRIEAYGRIRTFKTRESTGWMRGIQKSDWTSVLDWAAIQVVVATPFQGPKADGYFRWGGEGFW